MKKIDKLELYIDTRLKILKDQGKTIIGRVDKLENDVRILELLSLKMEINNINKHIQ